MSWLTDFCFGVTLVRSLCAFDRKEGMHVLLYVCYETGSISLTCIALLGVDLLRGRDAKSLLEAECTKSKPSDLSTGTLLRPTRSHAGRYQRSH